MRITAPPVDQTAVTSATIAVGSHAVTPDAHDADVIAYDPATSGLAATDVQAALDELDATLDGLTAPALNDLTDVDTTGVGDGDALVYDLGTTTWVPGTAGAGTPASTVTDETTWGISPAVGTDTEYARQDHTHGSPADPGASGGGFPLDSYAIDGTYGDDFTAASLAGIWTRRNYTSGAETHQAGKDATYLRIATNGRSNGDGYLQTAPAGDWTFAMAYIPRFYAGLYPNWGVCVIDASGNGITTLWYSNPIGLLEVSLTTYTGYGATFHMPGGDNSYMIAGEWNDRKVWVSLRKSGTSYYTAYSLDGEIWTPESAALVWAGTVDRVGMLHGPLSSVGNAGGTSVIDVDWFNKIA